MKKLLLICGLLAMVTRPAGTRDQLKLAVSPAHSHQRSIVYQDVTVIGPGGIGG